MEIKRANLFLTLLAIPLLLSCADDLKGPAGADAAATPNISIRGGGLIQWNSSNKQVSFTENIIIKDHARGSTFTITPGASAITLFEIGDVAYVELSKSSGATDTITKADVAQSGSIELTKSNTQAVTLFERTEEDTLYIPWVQKELVTGDQWRFGTTLSWYERIASSGKPAYTADTPEDDTPQKEDLSQIVVPATPQSPAVVIIDGKLFSSTKPVTLSLKDPKGCDGTAVVEYMAYYLYAVSVEPDRLFQLICSQISPEDGGPASTNSWSYIGSFATTQDEPSTYPFHAVLGKVKYAKEVFLEERGTVGVESMEIRNLPTTSRFAYFQINLRKKPEMAGATGSHGYIFGSNDTSLDQLRLTLNSADATEVAWGWVSVFSPKSIWVLNSSASNRFTVEFYGWQEDPMAYK